MTRGADQRIADTLNARVEAERREQGDGDSPGCGLVVVDITERAVVVSGLETEQPRYYLQHTLGFQVHDVRHPHRERRHGRAGIGWKGEKQDD